MLLTARESVSHGHGNNLLNRIVPAILCSVRETDIAGWHKDNSALGVIFTELGTADRNSIFGTLRAKVTTALRSILNTQDFEHIDIAFYCFPDDWSTEATGSPVAKLYPDLVERDDARRLSTAIKRAMDVLGSSMALMLLSPIFLLTTLAIKLSSPGPVLFRQKRIGQYGVPFTCLKFRSMYAVNDPQIHMEYVKRFVRGNVESWAPETNGKPIYKLTHDPRLTRVGRFLRKSSLDELPQLLNVFRGEMSMVGPRPAVPYEFEAYDIWHRRRLLEVKPGITGLWQVNGRGRVPFDEMVRLDLRYATTWSLWLDLKILLRTPQAVLSGDGAY